LSGLPISVFFECLFFFLIAYNKFIEIIIITISSILFYNEVSLKC